MDPTRGHAHHHGPFEEAGITEALRQWRLVEHLTSDRGHGMDRWGEIPSDPAARLRLHDDLHREEQEQLLPAVHHAQVREAFASLMHRLRGLRSADPEGYRVQLADLLKRLGEDHEDPGT